MQSKSGTAIVHTNFDEAFRDGRIFNRLGEELTVSVKQIGDLVTSTGRLLAHDPGSLGYVEESQAFIYKVKPGTYPAFISILQNKSEPNNEGLICALLVRFSDEPVVRWELALRPGETLPEADDGAVPAHSVDSAWTCFVDYKELTKLTQDERTEFFAEKIAAEAGGKRTDSAAIQINSQNGASLVACTTGFGDGGYSDFWGFAPDGTLAALATDFFILIEDVFSDIFINFSANDVGRTLKHDQLEASNLKCAVTALSKSTFVAKSGLSLEVIGRYDKHEGRIDICDRRGNKIGNQVALSSQGDVCKITYELSMPITEYATVRIKLRTGMRPL